MGMRAMMERPRTDVDSTTAAPANAVLKRRRRVRANVDQRTFTRSIFTSPPRRHGLSLRLATGTLNLVEEL
jgi:hypothetical protein